MDYGYCLGAVTPLFEKEGRQTYVTLSFYYLSVMRPSPGNDLFHCLLNPRFVKPRPVVRHGQGDQPDQAVKRVTDKRQDKEGIARGFQEEEEEFSNHLVNMDYELCWWLMREAHPPLFSQGPASNFSQSFFS